MLGQFDITIKWWLSSDISNIGRRGWFIWGQVKFDRKQSLYQGYRYIGYRYNESWLYMSRAAQRLNSYRQYNMGVVVVLIEVLIYWLTKRDGKRQTREFIGQIRELIHRPLGQHGAGSMRWTDRYTAGGLKSSLDAKLWFHFMSRHFLKYSGCLPSSRYCIPRDWCLSSV